MIANKTGWCPVCSQSIQLGQEITWARRGPLAGVREHVACYAHGTGKIPAENWPKAKQLAKLGEIELDEQTDIQEDTPFEPEQEQDTRIKLTPSTVRSNRSVDEATVNTLIDTIAQLGKRIAAIEKSGKPEVKLPEISHPLLPKLIKALELGKYPYLWSGAGAGKTHATLQAFEALGYDSDQCFVITCNPFSSPIELIGYTDANGELVEKAFLVAFREGYAVCLDEADRSRPDFLPALNSALAQKQLVAPDGEIVRMHPRFKLVLTGNTSMRGADKNYNSASRQDASVIDRLFYIRWTYDQELETRICSSYGEKGLAWASWIQSVRAFVGSDSTCAELNVTMRASESGIQVLLDGTFSVEDVMEAVLFKGLSADTTRRILSSCPVPKELR